ncbi:MAG: glycosyltransferase family 4 protein [Methanotrichaceae archaeon]|nr:glycosyltransferase family 4 protein [Methanotrichaceae archaeon]
MQDYEILSKHFSVEKVYFRQPKDVLHMIAPIWRSDLSFSWFASGHSFAAVLFSRILGKRSIVVAGGYDVAFEPEIDYGQYTLKWHKRRYADFVLRYADAILAVSEFTKGEVMARFKTEKVEVIYNGIDMDKFRPKGNKENLVITVASGSGNVIRLKGLDAFVKAAGYHPKIQFLVLGLSEADKKSLSSCCPSANVDLRGQVSQEELIGHYQKAKVYCQLSYRESFGFALAEAMACGCVPVVTRRGALPELVGDTGYYVPYADPEATAVAVQKAIGSSDGIGARRRIETRFSLKIREGCLLMKLHCDNSKCNLGSPGKRQSEA